MVAPPTVVAAVGRSVSAADYSATSHSLQTRSASVILGSHRRGAMTLAQSLSLVNCWLSYCSPSHPVARLCREGAVVDKDASMNIGKRIRKRRLEFRLTQNDLAGALGLTPQHISGIEQDKRAPSLLTLVKLAEELGVTVDYLTTGKEGVIVDTIPAIKADKRLSLRSKKALVSLVQELHEDPPRAED